MKPNLVMRWDVINTLLTATKGKRFLEIGVQRGVCASKVKAKEKWGVDPAALGSAKRQYKQLFHQPSDLFFSQLDPAEKFDVIMVDGLHHADQVHRDVENALLHLADGGYIVMHDCSPATEIAQIVPRVTGVWNGDCWKAMVELRKRTDLIAFTIDSDHGIGVVRRGHNPAPLTGVPGMKALSWTALDRNRASLVGLVPANRWEEHLGGPFKLGRVAVVSAIFGGRDEPVKLPPLDADQYILFTDGKGAAGWDIRVLTPPADPRLAARRIKTLALDFVDADVVVWIDGRITPTGKPLRPMLRETLTKAGVASFPHPWRDCIYAEANACAQLHLVAKADLLRQTIDYHSQGFPRKAGLWNTMVLARRRTDANIELGREWWGEISKHTVRDQISFPFVLWQAGLTCTPIGDDVYAPGSSPYFTRGRHRHASDSNALA